MIPLTLPRWRYHFRAWNKKERRMYVWDEMCENNDLEYFFTNPDIVPMMWTGVVDQNGTYIYDGDVIQCSNKAFEYEYEDDGETYTREWEAKEWKVEVKYEQQWCRFTVAADTCDLEKRMDPKAEYKGVVIGNIWQNPELRTN